MLLGKILIAALVCYGTVAVIMYFAQTALIFPAWMAGESSGALPENARRLIVEASDGVRLSGVHLPAGKEADQPALLAFGGNAWNAEDLALLLHAICPERDIIVFHYRGYGRSDGRPGANALQEDSLAIFDDLATRHDMDRVTAVGVSIGTGIASFLAAHRPVQGAVLITPFDSLKKLAQGHYWWLPVRPLMRHEMNTIKWLKQTRAPIALIAAGRDTIVPPNRTAPLRAVIDNLVYDETIGDAGHNSLYDHPDFPATLRQALKTVAMDN